MAEYVYTGTRAWSTVKASQNGDGTGTFWQNSFLPLADRVYSLGKAFATSGTPSLTVSLNQQGSDPADPDGTGLVGLSAIAGTGWTGGVLRVVMEGMVAMVDSLSNDKVDKSGDTMTGALTLPELNCTGPATLSATGITSTLSVDDTATFGAPLVANDKIIMGSAGAGVGRRVQQISNASTMLSTAKDVYWCTGPTAGRTLTLAITTAPTPVGGEIIHIASRSGLGAYTVEDEAGNVITTNLGSGTVGCVTVAFNAAEGRWQAIAAGGGATLSSSAI